MPPPHPTQHIERFLVFANKPSVPPTSAASGVTVKTTGEGPIQIRKTPSYFLHHPSSCLYATIKNNKNLLVRDIYRALKSQTLSMSLTHFDVVSRLHEHFSHIGNIMAGNSTNCKIPIITWKPRPRGLFLVKGPFLKIFLGGAYTWTNMCILF